MGECQFNVQVREEEEERDGEEEEEEGRGEAEGGADEEEKGGAGADEGDGVGGGGSSSEDEDEDEEEWPECSALTAGEEVEVRFEEDGDESDDGEWQGRGATAGVTWRPAKVVKTSQRWVHVSFLSLGGDGSSEREGRFRAYRLRRGHKQEAHVGRHRGNSGIGAQKRTRRDARGEEERAATRPRR